MFFGTFPFIFIIQKFSFIHSWLHKRFFITEKCLFKTIYFWNEPNKFIPNVIFLLVWISGCSGSEESVDSGAGGSRSGCRRLTESESDFFPEFEVRVLPLPGRWGGCANVRLFDETLKWNKMKKIKWIWVIKTFPVFKFTIIKAKKGFLICLNIILILISDLNSFKNDISTYFSSVSMQHNYIVFRNFFSSSINSSIIKLFLRTFPVSDSRINVSTSKLF